MAQKTTSIYPFFHTVNSDGIETINSTSWVFTTLGSSIDTNPENVSMPKIKDVRFYNKKATVVFWNDGTSTKAEVGEHDVFSEEYGLAICIAKKYRGGYDNFNKSIKKAKRYENNVRVKKNG